MVTRIAVSVCEGAEEHLPWCIPGRLAAAQEGWKGSNTCTTRVVVLQSQVLTKLLSILLLAVLGLPLASPLFALSTAGGAVPMCCRRGGQHHCVGGMDMQAAEHNASAETRVAAPMPRCPFCPRAAASLHVEIARPALTGTFAQGLTSYACGTAQVRSRWRIARERSRLKRGPPSIFSI